MDKNTAGQKLTLFAFNPTTNLPVTGDAANISASERIDGGTVADIADASTIEIDSVDMAGFYEKDLTQAETNGDAIAFSGKSSTSNVMVLAVPPLVYTRDPTAIPSGGGILFGKVSSNSLAPRKGYLELIQGEEKVITFIVEADGRFSVDSFDEITVKIADPADTVVTIFNDQITRIAEELDVQVFRATLPSVGTEQLTEGIARIEIIFDNQKVQLRQAIKISESLESLE